MLNTNNYFGLDISSDDEINRKIDNLIRKNIEYSYNNLNCECITLYLKCKNLKIKNGVASKNLINLTYYTKLMHK